MDRVSAFGLNGLGFDSGQGLVTSVAGWTPTPAGAPAGSNRSVCLCHLDVSSLSLCFSSSLPLGLKIHGGEKIPSGGDSRNKAKQHQAHVTHFRLHQCLWDVTCKASSYKASSTSEDRRAELIRGQIKTDVSRELPKEIFPQGLLSLETPSSL